MIKYGDKEYENILTERILQGDFKFEDIARHNFAIHVLSRKEQQDKVNELKRMITKLQAMKPSSQYINRIEKLELELNALKLEFNDFD